MLNDHEIDCLLLGPNQESDKRASTEITKQLQRDFEDVFSEIGCFDGVFSLQVKPHSKPYQANPRCIAYVLQNPFKEELRVTPIARHHNTTRHG